MTDVSGTDRERKAANLRRIADLLDPPPPTLNDRLRSARHAACEWWHRYVTQRELYRRFDAAQELMELKRQRDEANRDAPGREADALQRLRCDLSSVLRDMGDGPN